ncbi:two-component system histidine kinase PnpS [Virgibacillus ainsalahensis]
MFIILLLILLHIYDKFIKPINKVSKTMDEMVKGNYRARIHQTSHGQVAELSSKVNQLARNLSELSIQEQLHSEQLASVIDNTESGLVLIDEKGYIHLVNRKFISIFGNTPKDYNGHLFYNVIDNELIHQTVQHTFLYEKNIKKELSYFKGIDKHYLEVVGVPVLNDRNILKGAVLVLYDITELKRHELMRKDFVANVSHELKTPITSIKGFAETLLDDEMTGEDVKTDFLRIIFNESHRLQQLIDDLLKLSKLEKEGYPLVLSEVHPKSLVEEVIPAINYKAEQKQLQLSIDVKGDIVFKADRERIKQILINLLDNAIHYTSENGKVALKVDATMDYVHIQVTDTGIGIEPQALQRVFERFYRVDKARSRNTGGTGLGLAIVKHIVEVHEGKIKVDSEIDKGTAVHVYLPKDSSI